MSKPISKSIKTAFKWLSVVGATAAVVMSIQVSADGHGTAIKAVPLGDSSARTIDTLMPQAGFADLIEEVSPAVVHVATSGFIKRRSGQRGRQFQFPRGFGFEDLFPEFRDRLEPESGEEEEEGTGEKRPLGIGSGFIISADGLVVTNRHVIDKADEIIVTLTNGDEYVAEVKGVDEQTDLALLKLESAEELPFVVWGDDDKSRVGDWVLAIGNPFGLGGSASTGIISARHRDIRSGPYDDYIQVDAAINRGNSGGPLFNLQGQVIGINTAIYSPNGGSVGIGFSIPANLAKNVIQQLDASGAVERAWIGVSIQPLNDDLAEGFGRDDDEGALVSAVAVDTPADKAGLQAGDIILSFDGKEIEKMRDLPRIVAQSAVGEKYKLDIWRNGGEKSLTIRTERFPEDPTVASAPRPRSEPEEPEMDKLLGAAMIKLDDELRARFSIEESVSGVLVLGVEAGGLAAKNGLRARDVITKLDGKSATSPQQVIDIVRKAQKNGRNNLPALLSRGNSARFTPFTLN